MQKYDFEAPDIKQAVDSHKPNFVKAEKRVFEKSDGDQSDEQEKESEKKKKDSFKKVSREEWNNMSKDEKKKYLRERKKWKLSQTVFIKDDSDNEQLTEEENEDEDEENLKYSDSEDESEKQDRLAREALKSYAGAFKKNDAPEDYQLVMRKDVVEKELADSEDSKYETAEDIEFRQKREKQELKEHERKAKMREDRLKRMQAFQASSVLRVEPTEEDEGQEEEREVEEENEESQMETASDQFEIKVTTETKPAEENPFYSSYEALEEKDELEDPLKEERERLLVQQKEDEEELRKIKEGNVTKAPVFEAVEETAPPKKKPKIEISQMSSLGALKTMIESEKDKIEQEMHEVEVKTKRKEQQDKDAKKKKAEQVLRRGKKRGDPNNPSKEEVDAAQELEQMTWQDRYMKNKKVKDVVEKSQLMSKVKNKLKEDSKKEKETEAAPGVSDPAPSASSSSADAKDPAAAKESVIGSIEEYASLVGTSVSKLADTKYEAPEVEASEEEEEDSDNEGDDLWGAIMGGS